MNKEINIVILSARSKVYEVLASAFRYPWEEVYFEPIDMLGPMDIVLQDETGWEMAKGLIASMKRGLLTLDKESLQREYVRVFSHGFSKECPPYEVMYGSEGYSQQIDVLAGLCGIYREYGVELSDSATERMDHISIELEFMQYLTYKEAYGIGHGHKEESIEVVRAGQREFVRDHLGRWIPLFCQFLSQKAGAGLYYHLALFSSLFMANEVCLLGVKPRVVEAPDFHPVPDPGKYSTDSPNDPCESCFISGDEAIKELKGESGGGG